MQHSLSAVRRSIAVVACCLAAAVCQAQQVWSLQQCIDYASDHNIAIQQQAIAVESAESEFQTSRFARLPDLNANLGQSFGFGRSSDRYGQTVDRTSANTSFSVSSSVPLFTGMRIPGEMKARKFSLRAAVATLDKARQDLAIQVTTYYLNALYYRGLAAVARQQLELDREQLRVAETLVEAGKKPASERATAEAQVAATEYSLTQAEGNALVAMLDLRHALNLEATPFDIAEPDTSKLTGDIPLPDAVFALAVTQHPSILAAGYSMEASRHQLTVARSYLYPQLTFSAGYSNSFYHTYNERNTSLGHQLDLNGSEYLGLSLQIPIFNRFATRGSVRRARLAVASQEADLERARQTLQKDIEQAYWNAATSRDSHASATKAADAARLAYSYEADRYAAGKGTAVELQAARTKLQKAEQDVVQARYDYLMRLKILDFYVSGVVR